MAEDGTSANCSSMDVRLLINKKTGRVLYAEAGKDFVDLLLAFLLLPTGAIIRLLQEHGTASSKSVGSISNVYDSVRKMNAAYMITDKSILLEPLQESSPFNGLPLLQNSTTPREYYSCPIANNGYGKHQISTVPGQKCTCGQEIKKWFYLIISRPLLLLRIPGVLQGITLLNRLHVKDLSELKETTVTVGPEKVLELLGASMASKTALNDVFSPKSESASQVE